MDKCDHVVCNDCLQAFANQNQPTWECNCQHAEHNIGTASPAWPSSHGKNEGPNDSLHKLLEGQHVMNAKLIELASQRQLAQHKSHLKANVTIDFPKGNDIALEKLSSWFHEFERVVKHVSNNVQMSYEDRIVHLLACWPPSMEVGENMGLD